MRTYPRNSPEAAARLLALLLIADGQVAPSELDALKRLEAERELGLSPGALADVLQHLCEDLLERAPDGGAVAVGPDLLSAPIAEVDDPILRRKVVHFALVAIVADGDVAEGEIWILDTLLKVWKLDRTWLPAAFEAAVWQRRTPAAGVPIAA